MGSCISQKWQNTDPMEYPILMAKRRNFMVSFNFPVEASGEFFQQFAPLMRMVENFDIATVEEEVSASSQHQSEAAPSRLEPLPDLPEAPQTAAKQQAPRPGNPTTSEAARSRFRMDERGLAPSAREILTEQFAGRDSFLLTDAIKVLTEHGLSPRTAAPTLNNMKYRGRAEHLSSGKFRIISPAKSGNGNGSYTNGSL